MLYTKPSMMSRHNTASSPTFYFKKLPGDKNAASPIDVTMSQLNHGVLYFYILKYWDSLSYAQEWSST